MLCFWMAIPKQNLFDQFPSKDAWKCVFSNMFLQKKINTIKKQIFNTFYINLHFNYFQWNLNLIQLNLNPIEFEFH
jgi:hypothetical protein